MFRSAVVMTLALLPLAALAQEDLLSPQEIQAAWVGKTVLVRTAANDMLQLKLNADMTATIEGSRISDQGVWRLWEKGYCAKWQKIRKGEERCLTVRRQSQEIVNPDGSLNATVTEVR
jgi:hypothetical protein